MPLFKNIFINMDHRVKFNFKNLAMSRRAKMIQEGYDVGCINWELYTRVLEAKAEVLKHEYIPHENI